MEYDIIHAACIKEYVVYLKFKDGTEGVIDLAPIAGKGEMFAPLKDLDYFCQIRVGNHSHTIEWPNGADLSPEMLYEKIKHAENGIAHYAL